MRSPPSLHPSLLAVAPILSLVDFNLDSLEMSEFPRSLIVTVLCVISLQMLLRWRLRNPLQAGMILSLGLVLFLATQPVATQLYSLLPVRFAGVALPIVLTLASGGFVIGARLISRISRDLRSMTTLLNVGLLGVIALPVFHIGHRVAIDWRQPKVGLERQAHAELEPPRLHRPPEPPDIYFIVLDAYAREDVLKDYYGLDNAGFIDFLRRSGFQVADRSFSNYMMTMLELPAVTNLGYLDQLGIPETEDPVERGVPSDLLPRNRVVRALQEIGYRIVDISTGFDRASLEGADLSVAIEAPWWTLNELERFLVSMTVLGPAAEAMHTSPSAYFALHRRRILHAFDRLGEMPELLGPKLVYAHIQAPHQPFVFDAEGEDLALDFDIFQSLEPRERRAIRSAYAAQVLHTNTLIERAVSAILADSTVEPVIIIQGDHGLRLSFDKDPNKTCYRECFGVLNAIRFPNAAVDPSFTSSTSPINTFRIVFDHVFDTELGLLSDRSFFAHRIRSWNFPEVTGEVSSCLAPAARWAPTDE